MSNPYKTLWFFNQPAVTPDMQGGTRHYDLGRELTKRGYDVTIFASSFHHNQHKETKLSPKEKWKLEEIDGIKFVWIRTFPFFKNNWRRVLNMASFMIRAYFLGRNRANNKLQKPDIIIGSSVHLLSPLAGYHAARFHKAHFVFEVRDLWPKTLIDIGHMSRYHPFIVALSITERFLYKKAEKIITLLPFAHRYITPLGVPPRKNHLDTQRC